MAVGRKEQALRFFTALLGNAAVLTVANDIQEYATDWTKIGPPSALCVLLPSTTEQVSEILKYCNNQRIPVVPSGGRTGLAGGAVARSGEVLISMSRFNKIEAVDRTDASITCGAGVTTAALQEEALRHGLFFPIDLASKGSSQIGGNVATNAAGLKFIRYGGTREQVLGLEVVLADGGVWDLTSSVRKNNSGYDLKQLFIGSEGTLGIITRVTLRLVPQPKRVALACIGIRDFTQIMDLFQDCLLAGLQMTAFEFFTESCHKLVLANFADLTTPFQQMHPYYVILEVEEPVSGVLEEALERFFTTGLIADAVLATTSEEFRQLWRLRENISEAIAMRGHVHKNDVALPVGALREFIDRMTGVLAGCPRDIALYLFGHIGDGNIHINYSALKAVDKNQFRILVSAIEQKIFEQIANLRGSISAEHGIGLLKKDELHFTRSPAEIAHMRGIKRLFDPNSILNPGKIFSSVH